ncbi:hypothetical protein Cabys_99 [Caldithrix abyssi DSM 13497]|uniref:Uncharacterized protein n=1 Tax=Caldithrix abyssi DSM 13497 TaxID=880073 RepID=A0A1J1C4A6_CALAY|nr:hypothetical protein Cabys_99 [Caldithrix abyssi DSM 13497]
MLSEVETTVDCEETFSGYAPFDYAQGAGVRLLSEVETTVDYEETFINCAPFDYAQGAEWYGC